MQTVEPYYESPALRRAASANSTPRKLRALKRIVDEELGPDTSTELYRYADGWTVRLIETIADKRRDGWLMKACLRGAWHERAGSWLSLRDGDGLPHLLFHAWSIIDADPEIVGTLSYRFDCQTELLALCGAVGRGNSYPKQDYLDRLPEFAASARLDDPGVTIGSYVLLPFPIRSLSFKNAFTLALIGAAGKASGTRVPL